MSEEEFAQFVDESYAYLQAKIDACNATWAFMNYERWDVNQDTGLLIFSQGARPPITCSIQFVGSYLTTKQRWRWAWANPSIDAALKSDLEAVRQFGKDQQIREILTDVWPATEGDAWAMTAVTAKILQAESAYRGPAGPLFTFMIIKGVRWHTG
jgi:hypothetical protein